MLWTRSIILGQTKSPLISGRIGQHDRTVPSNRGRGTVWSKHQLSPSERKIMIPMRHASAAVALAITAAITPLGRSDAATDKVIEMPNGLKYTDTETGDGATAAAGKKVSVHYTGWLSNNGAKGRNSTARSIAASPFNSPSGRIK